MNNSCNYRPTTLHQIFFTIFTSHNEISAVIIAHFDQSSRAQIPGEWEDFTTQISKRWDNT